MARVKSLGHRAWGDNVDSGLTPLAASFVPACRAASVNPTEVLRAG
jgi:hypothetical protein